MANESALTLGTNILVLAAMTAVVRSPWRLLAFAAVLLFTVAFPPFSWPTAWFCFAPLLWMWRDRDLKPWRLVSEAVAVGFAMGWLSSGFVRAGVPAWGSLAHAAGCLVFSLQFVAVAAVIWLTRKQPVLLSAPICAVTAVGGELFEAWCGISWSISNFSLTVGATPVAQWSRWITPFGVAGVLYLVNFLMVRSTWIGPSTGIGVAVLAWCGGIAITASSVEPLPFSALLVQPHMKGSKGEPWRPWLNLDRMTRNALREAPVDLVVWPELSLSHSWSDGSQSGESEQLTIQDFSRSLTPVYQTNCLVGVVMSERGTTQRYGLEVADVRRYNCGCLVTKSGEISRHEKLALVPFKEGLPGLLDCDWIRSSIIPALGFRPPLAYGRNYRPFSFRDGEGRTRSIAVSVCYESLLPWLPQYRDDVEAIIHLVYDGNTAEHPSMMQRHIRACQYRAIETRKWNLVCSMWSGSVIIDPTGKIVDELPAIAGVLRTTEE